MKLKLKLNNTGLEDSLLSRNYDRACAIMSELREDKEDYTGWVNWPAELPEELISDMENTAAKIAAMCDKLIVIGIGGSYLGTAAVIEAIGGSKPGCPEVIYAGNNISGNYLSRIVETEDLEDICLCVVSKSGTTMESRIAFSILKERLFAKYGEAAADRIVAITDCEKGLLRAEANEKGYKTYEIPSNIGGRYSAFTAGIMFPLAVAGVDIRAFVQGAKDIQADEDYWKTEGMKYALTRYALLEAGKSIEVFEYYDPSMRLVGEWCKQLFGESEGKECKGLFPASLTFSTDLHSMGQFLQEGSQIFFETVINVLNWSDDVIVPETAGDELAGMSLNAINQMAIKGVMAAHRKADIPIVQIELKDNNEYCLGQLFYFLMMTAAVTGKLMGIDPFNQPGVEAYKSEIRKLLGQ